MKIITLSTEDASFSTDALRDADFIAVHGNCDADLDSLKFNSLNGQIHGATSCLGAMTDAGVSDSVGLFIIEDPDGAYGTALVALGADPADAARNATLAALKQADRIGEAPDLIWVSSTPGSEEAVLTGIEAVVGAAVPIIGGSAADNSVSGEWLVFNESTQMGEGVIVSVLFPSCSVSFAYHNGYAPTASGGTVTRVTGRRVHEIDHRPAIDVYREWTNNAVEPSTNSRSILSESTLWPLGRKVAELDGVSSYLLAHPAVANDDGSIDMFATVEEGEFLTQMNGTETSLVERAGRVASLARAAGKMEGQPIAGALMVYCGGCMLSVRDRLDEVIGGVSHALDGAPFLGTFTFGEQGQILGAGNRHGNLMISCIIFG